MREDDAAARSFAQALEVGGRAESSVRQLGGNDAGGRARQGQTGHSAGFGTLEHCESRLTSDPPGHLEWLENDVVQPAVEQPIEQEVAGASLIRGASESPVADVTQVSETLS